MKPNVRANFADDVDFLPISFRQQHTGRRTTARCMAATGVCAAMLVSLFLVERQTQNQLDAEMAIVATQHQLAVVQTKQLADLQATASALDHQAQLYTYLRHPWPKSVMLDTIARSAPDSVELTKIEITRSQPQTRSTPRNSTSATSPEPSRGVEADLEQLRRTYDNTRVRVAVEGITYDVTQFHALFMSRLNEASLFQASTLLYVKHEKSLPSGGSQFRVNLTVKPGYGQARGPRGDLATFDPTGQQRDVIGYPATSRRLTPAASGGGVRWNK